MQVCRKSLRRLTHRHSFYLSVLCPSLWQMPSPAYYARTFSSNFLPLPLPNSCHRQLGSVDVAKALLPAHYPTPTHKLIGLNNVINRWEKQLSMFVALPKVRLLGCSSPSLFSSPAGLPTHIIIMHSPPFLWTVCIRERLTPVGSS